MMVTRWIRVDSQALRISTGRRARSHSGSQTAQTPPHAEAADVRQQRHPGSETPNLNQDGRMVEADGLEGRTARSLTSPNLPADNSGCSSPDSHSGRIPYPLQAGLEYDVEWRLGGTPYSGETSGVEDVAQLSLARLGAKRQPHVL